LIVRLAIAGAALVLPLHSALAQFFEQGPKLVGSGISGNPEQGNSVALSADGNTAIIGAPFDGGGVGAAWVFTRSAGVWSQQGVKLVGTGPVGNSQQGHSVGLSADGNAAIVGGWADNSNSGAAWIFTRSGGVWTQQGDKLVGSGASVGPMQGGSVALSGDANTAIVGGPLDTSNNGAVWVYTRSAGIWSQQGAKLTGDAGSRLGASVALSADGNIALAGEPRFNSAAGTVAVFGRSGGVWTLQNGLVGSGATGNAAQGWSVALSADGRTAIVGGPTDNGNSGAAWVFIRTGANSWFQQGMKLIGTGEIGGGGEQGFSVALSVDGNTAIVGGPQDNANLGAAWAFTRSGTTWTQLGSKLVGAAQLVGTLPRPAVEATAVPFMNHIAVLPPVSRQSKSYLPSPLKSR
jgi:FG-GAP repeat